MSHEKFSADLAIAIAGAVDDGMTTVTIARILRQSINLLNMSTAPNDPTLTTARSGSSRTAQCL